MCSKGHTWETGFNIIKQGGWCPRCDKEIKTKVEKLKELKAIAKEKGGKCLSDEYINNRTKLEFQCSEGHIWETTPDNVISNKWCRICSYKDRGEKRKDNIETYRKIAEERGGKLLSGKYINSSIPLLWECSKGHQWKASPTDVKNNKHWCPVCGRKAAGEKRKDNIETYQKVAIERGGKLISDKYINSSSPLLWECAKGHQWKARPNEVKNKKQWCPFCAGVTKHTIKDMQELAAKRGGKCLSKEYKNNKTELKWQCSEGHIWKAPPHSILSNRWCLKCSHKSTGEKLKDNIETYKKIAAEHGGKLLSDKYIDSKTPLLWECSKGHQWKARPEGVKNNNYWCTVCAGKAKHTIQYMHQLAANRGGKCLSKVYINNRTKLEWRCNKGHQWKADLASVKDKKKWCPFCSRIARKGKRSVKSKDK
jgi:hypothetical protein